MLFVMQWKVRRMILWRRLTICSNWDLVRKMCWWRCYCCKRAYTLCYQRFGICRTIEATTVALSSNPQTKVAEIADICDHDRCPDKILTGSSRQMQYRAKIGAEYVKYCVHGTVEALSNLIVDVK